MWLLEANGETLETVSALKVKKKDRGLRFFSFVTINPLKDKTIWLG